MRAKQLLNGHDIELWQRDRKIAALKHANKTADGPFPEFNPAGMTTASAWPSRGLRLARWRLNWN